MSYFCYVEKAYVIPLDAKLGCFGGTTISIVWFTAKFVEAAMGQKKVWNDLEIQTPVVQAWHSTTCNHEKGSNQLIGIRQRSSPSCSQKLLVSAKPKRGNVLEIG